MDKNALARSNHLFFYVDLTQHCLLTDEFKKLCGAGAREATYREKYPEYVAGDDGIQQLPFRCHDGELGYLRFSNDTARLLVKKQVKPFSLAIQIPPSIRGEFNECCEFILEDVIRVSFKIIGYEGILIDGRGYVDIKNPVSDCPTDDFPLGRIVEMTIIRQTDDG